MQCIILAAGKGTRLRPLTENTPKPMLVAGKKPILLNIVEKFLEHGYKNIIMCVNYKSDIITNYFGDGKKFGVNIEYIYEKQRMGTAGALSLLRKLLSKYSKLGISSKSDKMTKSSLDKYF